MPSPKRVDLNDYFDRLDATQEPHLTALRRLSLAADPDLEEKLAWNNPAYHKDGVRLWMLQAFKHHCSLRFPPSQFGPHRDEVRQAA